MAKIKQGREPQKLRKTSRIPENSPYFEKVVPTALIIMAIVTLGLILFAVSVLVGIVSF